MESDNNKCKTKRSRSTPIRKWEPAEEKAIVEFLMENRNFEKPTAQLYYTRFAREKRHNIRWKLLRAKVRNMRINFKKAKTWVGSDEASYMNDNIKKIYLQRKCFYYDEFKEIFDREPNYSAPVENVVQPIPNFTENESRAESLSPVEVNMEPEIENPILNENGNDFIHKPVTLFDVMHIHGKISSLRKERMETETALREKEIRLKEKELELRAKEIELKEMEISGRLMLKKNKLKMQHRLAVEELLLSTYTDLAAAN